MRAGSGRWREEQRCTESRDLVIARLFGSPGWGLRIPDGKSDGRIFVVGRAVHPDKWGSRTLTSAIGDSLVRFGAWSVNGRESRFTTATRSRAGIRSPRAAVQQQRREQPEEDDWHLE
jgi:hypothetical protein